ncbi:MAG: ribosome recycling factor [Gammaproteobacteria bacterium]|nr:ribosome recycling factor [Gammaproteobacteria bacterium]
MIDEIKEDAGQRMRKTIDALQQELQKIRTGRAHTSLLDHVKVSYYGSEVPLNQVATITVSDARTLAVTPWEKKSVPDVEKAIMNAGLGLNPVTAGEVMRIPLPPLTEERRKDLVRVVKQEAENARVAVRNIRRDANGQLKMLLKEKEISEDEDRGGESDVQAITDKFIAEIEDVLKKKEADLLEV